MAPPAPRPAAPPDSAARHAPPDMRTGLKVADPTTARTAPTRAPAPSRSRCRPQGEASLPAPRHLQHDRKGQRRGEHLADEEPVALHVGRRAQHVGLPPADKRRQGRLQDGNAEAHHERAGKQHVRRRPCPAQRAAGRLERETAAAGDVVVGDVATRAWRLYELVFDARRCLSSGSHGCCRPAGPPILIGPGTSASAAGTGRHSRSCRVPAGIHGHAACRPSRRKRRNTVDAT